MTNKQLKDNMVESYNRQADQRNKGGIEEWKANERAHFLSLLRQENKNLFLEIGAGHGRDSLFFQKQGFKIIAIDITPAMVNLCKQKGITVLVMDMIELGFKNNSFDAVYALNSFLHVSKEELPKALDNVSSILQPAGLFYLGMYGGHDFEGIWEQDSYTPKRFFSLHSEENLKRILANPFEIVYFKQIALGEENLPFQSVILKKRAS